jgi:hypothetical protein
MADDSFSPTTIFLALLISTFVATIVYGQARLTRWSRERIHGPTVYDDEALTTVRFNHDTDIYEEENDIPLVELPLRPIPLNLRRVHFETPLRPMPRLPSLNNDHTLRVLPSIYSPDDRSLSRYIYHPDDKEEDTRTVGTQ